MAEQTQPQENWRFIDQTPYANNQAEQSSPIGQNPGLIQPFVAPAESFGPFGPLPDYPAGAFANESPFLPTNAPQLGLDNAYAPAPSIANTYPAFSPAGNPYASGMPGALPYGMYPPFPVPVKTKKPLLFPFTRRAPVLLQIFGMLLYSLVMSLGIMGCLLTLLKAALVNTSMYVNPDGSANGLSIIVTIVLLLFLVPACSLFSGVFFGSWRGLIVAVLSFGGGFLLAHVSDPRFGNPNATLLNYLPFAALPLAALVVGFVYERRKYAAWWKSMLTMFLGTGVLLTWFLAFIYLADVNAGGFDTLAANAHMTIQNYMASIAISLGCVALLVVPLLGLLFAGIEGIIHAIIAGIRQKG